MRSAEFTREQEPSPRERFERTPSATGKLVIFDIDDTLVNTDTKINVVRDGKIVKQLNSHDFTHYHLQPGEEFDFGRFRDAREFYTQARPIPDMMRQLRRDIETGNKVIMLTARSDFNDRDVFLDTFRQYGIDMDRVHVYRAGNLAVRAATEEKKKIILKHLLGKHPYEQVIMYDDSVPNLNAFLSLAQDYPWSRFYAWHVDPSGQAAEYHRTNVRVPKEKLREIGDAPSEYEPNRRRRRSLFHAEVDDQWVDVFFDRSALTDSLQITFTVNQNYEAPARPTRASSSVIRILSTVLKIIREQLPRYMRSARPPRVTFTAKGASRIELYKRYFVPVIQEILGDQWQLEIVPGDMTLFRWEPRR
jgi:FMN phosphatase YigB (HAD superfamily)